MLPHSEHGLNQHITRRGGGTILHQSINQSINQIFYYGQLNYSCYKINYTLIKINLKINEQIIKNIKKHKNKHKIPIKTRQNLQNLKLKQDSKKVDLDQRQS